MEDVSVLSGGPEAGKVPVAIKETTKKELRRVRMRLKMEGRSG